jgi:hypothetical protein
MRTRSVHSYRPVAALFGSLCQVELRLRSSMLSHYRTLLPLARNNSSGRQPLPWDYFRVVNPEVIQKR